MQSGDLLAAVMAEKGPNRVKFIEVRPSNDNENISPCVGKNDNAISPVIKKNIAKNDNVKFFPLKPPIPKTRKGKIESSFREVEITIADHIQDMFLAREAKVPRKLEKLDVDLLKENEKKTKDDSIEENQEKVKKKKKRRKRKNRRVLPLDDQNGETGDSPGSDSGSYDKTEKKKKRTNTKTKESKTEVKEVKAAPSEKDQAPKENVEKEASTRRKLPCLFGFIATWLAKRKEKRREKKRKAIAARTSLERLVEYNHKTAHGGEAFTIEFDSRPICLRKPLLPPILVTQTSGPIRREKQQNADCRREGLLEQRRGAAREYEKKKTRCKERKYEKDIQFRHKTDLAIRQKQVIAERNRELQSRCKSTLRAPSVGPSAGPSKEPSAEPSLFSITGPSFYDNEFDRYFPNVDEDVDIPIF